MSKFIVIPALSAALVAAAFGLAQAQTGGGSGTGSGSRTRSAPTTTTAPTAAAPSTTTAPGTTTAPATKTTRTAPKHTFCPPGQRGKHNNKFAC
jgi:hypothetical protein